MLEFLADEKSLTRLEQEVKHPIALLDFLGGLSDDDRFSELARQLYEQQREKAGGGEWKMCELVTELIEQGRAEGIQQEVQQGIQNVIATCKYFKASFEQTEARIREQYQLDEEAVRRNMELYW